MSFLSSRAFVRAIGSLCLPAVFFLVSLSIPSAEGQTAGGVRPRGRIAREVVDTDTFRLPGNVHPGIYRAVKSAPAEPGAAMRQVVLHLQSSAEQEAELERLIGEQSDPRSENYHRYLTPAEFSARFGVAQADIDAVSDWLRGHGLTVEETPEGNRSIVFSGGAEQIGRAFKTEIARYTLPDGTRRLANAADPQIPAAFAGVVGGVLKLHDFPYEAQSILARKAGAAVPAGVTAAFAPSGLRMLTPGDYYNIYDINPLLNAGIDGTGQSIAVLARSNIYVSDVSSFRSMFGLPANDPRIIVTNSDPGQKSGDNLETTLDTEWAGAVAPGAAIKVIVSASAGSDGIDLSAIYAVTKNVAPIVTVSYAGCESAMGATELAFYNSLWKQAAAQGQTVLVASGDTGAAGCDSSNASSATKGKAVNGLCSSPYATCVGGTQFVEGSNPGQYWFPSAPDTLTGTAKGYVPETVWNESGTFNGASSIWAGGGGASGVYAKPAWQAGPGVPADGKRDVPDVSLTAAYHDGYTVVQGGFLGFIFAMSGTSASAPSFAGMVALVNQKTKSAQGNINPVLYALAQKQASGGAAVFHDVTAGNNTVPGQAGYSAGAGYDLATGLGSVDANLMATVWNSAAAGAPLTVYANSVMVNRGQSASTNAVTLAAGLNAAVNLSVSGAPAGITAVLAKQSVASPGSGTVAVKVTVAASVAPGVYSLGLNASSGSQTAASNFAVTVTEPTFALTYGGGMYPSVIFGPNPPFTPQTIALQTLPSDGFNSPVALSAAGMPAGMTVSFSPAVLPGSTVGNSVATVSAASTVKGGSYKFNITAAGGGVTRTVEYRADVFVQPSCSLTTDQFSVAFKAGSSATFNLGCTAAKAGTTPISLSLSGLPGGLTAKFSPATLTPGGSATLVFSSAKTMNSGTYPVNLTASEASGASQMVSLYLAVSTPVFTLSLNPAKVTGSVGSATPFTAVVTPDAGFSSPVTVWIGSRPVGVSASFSQNSVTNPSSTITLTIDKTAVPGTYPLTVGAIANTGYSRTVVSTLTIAAGPACNLASGTAAVGLAPGKSASAQLTCAVTSGSFSAPLSLSAGGLPQGVTAQFTPASLTPGSAVTLTLTGAATAASGSSAVVVTAAGSGFSRTVSIPLTIAVPSFSLSANSAAAALKAGSTASVVVSSSASGSYNSPIALTAQGLPAGVTAKFSSPTLAATGSVTVTLAAASTAVPGAYPINLTGVGGGLTGAAKFTLNVTR